MTPLSPTATPTATATITPPLAALAPAAATSTPVAVAVFDFLLLTCGRLLGVRSSARESALKQLVSVQVTGMCHGYRLCDSAYTAGGGSLGVLPAFLRTARCPGHMQAHCTAQQPCVARRAGARVQPRRRTSPGGFLGQDSTSPRTRVGAAAAMATEPLQPFEFASAGRIVFGRGKALQTVPQWAKEQNAKSALLVTGTNTQRAQPFADALKALGVRTTFFPVGPGEPTLETAEACTEAARACGAEVVISIGGGSAVDTGKAVAALVRQPEGLLTYMEVVGAGKAITERPLPFCAVPTTAGTGSEVTRNSVFESPTAGVKASIRHAWMLPSLAIVDPLLTVDVPPSVTACTGLDALTQCMEPYVCCSPNPMVDALALEGLRRAGRSVRVVYADGKDLNAREDMCVASLFGGLSLANAKLGAVHGFAGPLGGMIHGPHGGLCAALLPACMTVNVTALREAARGTDGAAAAARMGLERYNTVAQLLTNRSDATAEDGVKWIKETCSLLSIPGLASYGMTRERFAEAVEKGKKSSSMKGNPIALSDAQLTQILEMSM